MAKKLHQYRNSEPATLKPAILEPRARKPAAPCQQPLQAARMHQAKSLATDPNYPSDDIIQVLAEMLARHWYS